MKHPNNSVGRRPTSAVLKLLRPVARASKMGLDWTLDDPCAAVDAPMLESEDRAREIWDEYRSEQFNGSFEEFFEKRKGCPDCEKCRVWEEYLDDDAFRSGSFLTSPCEFRGKRLKYTDLPKEVAHKAWEDRTPKEMEHYADILENEVDRLPAQQDWETVQQAINWLRFWADQGVSMGAWY